MPSPFPGMDPDLEDPAFWLDFHSRFVNCWCESLADVLPDVYEARIGERVYLVEQPLPAWDCYYLISRWEPWPDSQVYCWSIRQPFPCLPVPLRAPDQDVVINYASIFTTAYDRGRFRRSISYQHPCPAPLNAPDQRWAETVVAEK